MKEIQAERAEYRAHADMLRRYRDLYSGGDQFLANAVEYLLPRYSEPPEVYSERVQRAYYENYVGSIIDWYATTLFRREPLLTYTGSCLKSRDFYNDFAEDCDMQGNSLSDFFRRSLTEALVSGSTYIAVDFPKGPGRAKTRAEEDALGISRAYLREYPAASLVNWERNERGEFEWVVLRSERRGGQLGRGSGQTAIVRWLHLDRQNYKIYEAESTGERQGGPVLLDEGLHGLARLGRVPLFEMKVSEGLWLMNKAATLQLEHFSKSNALSWALTNGLFAMPVIYSDKEFEGDLGEGYYLRLGAQDRFGWSEPEGHIFELALKNIDRLKEEIYRVCYLLSQAGGSMSKDSSMTGLSKQRDFAITQEVLRGYGDLVKDTMKKVLRAVAAARGDEIEVDVAGLDEFDIGDFSAELADAERILALGIPSTTLKGQIFKKLAMKYLCDGRQEMKDQIAREIDKGM
jgi:hypothetical protein